jgi:hypothetical protein
MNNFNLNQSAEKINFLKIMNTFLLTVTMKILISMNKTLFIL